MADIFVSYSRADRDAVAKIVALLEAQGWSVWWDTRLRAGEQWDEVIERELTAARCVLVVWSPASVTRYWVKVEANFGLERQILVPVAIEGAKPPLAFTLIQAADFSGWTGSQTADAARRVVEDVREKLAQTPLPAPELPPVPVLPGNPVEIQPSRQPWKLIAGGAAAAVIAAFFILQPWKGKETPAPASSRPGLTALNPNRAAVWLSPSELAVLKPRDEFQECPECPRMVVVPPGTFVMGSPDGKSKVIGFDGKEKGEIAKAEEDREADESPQHEVQIPNAFAVGKFEVTVREYMVCVTAKKCRPPEWLEERSSYNIKTGSDNHYKKLDAALSGDNFPIIGVSWDDALAYTKFLNEKPGFRYRLLAEAEWEYATRGGTTTRYSFGESISKSQAQYSEGSWGSAGKTVEVGSFVANRFGLHDMHGNVWEWVRDCYIDNYNKAPRDGSAAPETSSCRRVLRGGSLGSYPLDLRAANRSWDDAANRDYIIGFRVARTLNP